MGPEPLPGLNRDDWEGPTLESAGAARWQRPFAPIRYTERVIDRLRTAHQPPPELVYARYSLMSRAPARVASLVKRPCVLEVNGLSDWFSSEFKGWRGFVLWPLIRRIERSVIQGARLCIAISSPVAAQLEAGGVPKSRILKQANGVEPDRFPENLSGRSVRTNRNLGDSPVVGFVGTFGDWHGAENLVRAMPLVLQTHPDARFLFVGDGARRAPAQELCQTLGISHAALFTGIVPHEEAPPYLAACDVLVAPHSWNRQEPFIGSPTKVFEYMAAGKGIVASRLGQIGELIEDGKTGLLVTPDDTQALAEAISRLLDAPAVARDLGARARATVLARHTWRRNVEEILDWLEKRSEN